MPMPAVKALEHNSEKDRIFEIEWAGLVDESRDDGELICKIFLDVVGS